jgi:pyroglutamyl-peptidase
MMNKRRVLLTGFTAFGSVAVNPSQLIVEQLAGSSPTLVTAVLPVEYAGSRAALHDLLRMHQPDAFIGLGVASGRRMISLERLALNLDDAAIPDNAGVALRGQLIDAEGPAAYWSTLPLDAIYTALSAEHIPVHFSNHAGNYVCNHLFYCARHAAETWAAPIPSGFVHLPPIDETGENGLPFEILLQGVSIVLDVVAKF